MKPPHPLSNLIDVVKVNDALVRLLLPISLDNVYEAIVTEAIKLVGAVYGSIFLFDEKTQTFNRAYTNVKKNQQFLPRANGNTYWVYINNKPRLVPREILAKAHPEIDKIVHSVLLIPLSYQNEKLGVLSLKSSLKAPFTRADTDGLILFGTTASLAIRNAQLYKQNQQALEMRDLFMSTASHEFKTPLTAIKSYAQLFQRTVNPDKEFSQQTISAILRNVNRLTDMINSLFLASQISAGTFQVHYQVFDLCEVLQQCIDDIRVSSHRNIQFVCDIPVLLFNGDKNHICSVIINLIRNSITYSPDESVITVGIKVEKKTVVLTVADQGQGITAKDLRHIFEKYFRPNNQQAGLGLGLYLCFEIVKAHNGTISMESTVGKGTTVTIKFPQHYNHD